MRFVCTVFNKGTRRIVETTDDGDFVGFIEGDSGKFDFGEDHGYLEFGCDEKAPSIDLMVKLIDDMRAELLRRKTSARKPAPLKKKSA